MPRSITMLPGRNVSGDVGQGLLTGGNTYTVSSALAHELVNRQVAVYATPSYNAPGIAYVVSRTPAQLAGTPFTEDVAMAQTTEFVDSTDPTKRYTVNAAGTQFVQLGGGGSSTGATVQISTNVVITAANAAVYNGQVLEFTGPYQVTLSKDLPNDFGFAGIPPSSGVATIASDGTTTIDGSTASVTKSTSNAKLFSITQRNTNRNAYISTGG